MTTFMIDGVAPMSTVQNMYLEVAAVVVASAPSAVSSGLRKTAHRMEYSTPQISAP